MKDRTIDARTNDESGSALILAVFVLVILASMGTALLFVSQTELKVNRADLEAKEAFYLAEAGLEATRMTLFSVNGSGSFSDDLVQAAGADGVLNFDPTSVGVPSFAVDGTLADLNDEGPDDVPISPIVYLGTSTDGGWITGYLTNDPLEPCAGTPPACGVQSLTDTNDRVLITGVGVASGRAMEVVQAIIEPVALLPPIPPAAITLLGPTPLFDSGNSNAEGYTGDDCGVSGGAYVPIVGTVGAAAEASAEAGLSPKPTFDAGPYSGAAAIVDLDNPADPLMVAGGLSPIDPMWKDCLALKDFVEALKSQATYYCNASNCNSLPPTVADSVSFLEKHTQISLGPGYIGRGVLVVTGPLNFRGNAEFDGIILAIGQGRFQRAGGGNGYVSGAVIVADIAGPNGRYGDSDDCTGGPAGDGFGIADYGVNGGGNSDILYCSANLSAAQIARTYRIVEFVQR